MADDEDPEAATVDAAVETGITVAAVAGVVREAPMSSSFRVAPSTSSTSSVSVVFQFLCRGVGVIGRATEAHHREERRWAKRAEKHGEGKRARDVRCASVTLAVARTGRRR